jgi:hypothetical protein
VGTAPSRLRKDPAGVAASVLSPAIPAQSRIAPIVTKVTSSAFVGSAAAISDRWDADPAPTRENDLLVLRLSGLPQAAGKDAEGSGGGDRQNQKEEKERSGSLHANCVPHRIDVRGGDDQVSHAPIYIPCAKRAEREVFS